MNVTLQDLEDRENPRNGESFTSAHKLSACWTNYVAPDPRSCANSLATMDSP